MVSHSRDSSYRGYLGYCDQTNHIFEHCRKKFGKAVWTQIMNNDSSYVVTSLYAVSAPTSALSS